MIARGPEILHAEAYGKQDTVFTAIRVIELAGDWGMYPADAHRIAVDDSGVGGGVVDILRSNGWPVNAENFGEKPKRDEDTVFNHRTELWVAMRDWLRSEASLSRLDRNTREELRSDLTTVKYSFKPDGRRILEPKDDIRKRIGRSPDYGDALALAIAWKTVPRRLDYSAFLRREEGDRAKHHCTDEDPCRDRDCRWCERRRRSGEDIWDGYRVKPPRNDWYGMRRSGRGIYD